MKDNDISKEKKPNLTIEELVKYIKQSDEMKKPPKKRMYYKTKRRVALIAFLILFILYTVFIWRPFDFKIKFKEETYDILGTNITTLKNKTIKVDSGDVVEVGENIVKILPYVNYKDEKSRYAALLSEKGNIYNYNLDSKKLYKYDTFLENIADIKEENLDIYDVIEITTSKNKKYVLGSSSIIKQSVDELKLMDNIHYEFDGYFVYTRETNLHIANYEKVAHFSMIEEKEIKGIEKETSFIDKEQNNISYIEILTREYEDNLYIYGITSGGELTVYKINTQDSNILSLGESIRLDLISFNKKIKGFDKDYFSETSVRILPENSENIIEVFLDKLILGSLSNDERLLAYNTDFKDGTKYNVVENNNGVYLRYDDAFYTCYTNDEFQCVYLNSYGELIKVVFHFENNDLEFDTVTIKLDNNLSVEDIYYKEGRTYIKIKETIKNEYIVFESTTDIKYHEYLLEDFINKQIGG